MRFMLIARLSTETSNALVRERRIGDMMQRTLAELKPEAAYFGPFDGGRTAFIVLDMDDPSKIPAITEPFFQELGAHVDIFPVMTGEDLARGLASMP